MSPAEAIAQIDELERRILSDERTALWRWPCGVCGAPAGEQCRVTQRGAKLARRLVADGMSAEAAELAGLQNHSHVGRARKHWDAARTAKFNLWRSDLLDYGDAAETIMRRVRATKAWRVWMAD